MAGGIPLARIEQIKSKFYDLFKNASGDGISVVYNNLKQTVLISINYVTKNLKITGGKLDTIQDISTDSSPEFSGLKIGTDSGLLGKNTGTVNTVSVNYPLVLNNNTLSVEGSVIKRIASENITIGDPIAVTGDNTVGVADNVTNHNFIGISNNTCLSSEEVNVQIAGEVSTNYPYGTKLFLGNREITSDVPFQGYLVYVGISTGDKYVITNNLKVKL